MMLVPLIFRSSGTYASADDACLKGLQDKMVVSDAYQESLRQQLALFGQQLSSSEYPSTLSQI